MSFFWVGHFEFFFRKKNFFFCFIPMKISPNLYGRMDGSKFWCFPWFPENSSLCVILRYTVYIRNVENWWCQLISISESFNCWLTPSLFARGPRTETFHACLKVNFILIPIHSNLGWKCRMTLNTTSFSFYIL